MNTKLQKYLILFGCITPICIFYLYGYFTHDTAPIKVGILHSRTGALAISEEAVIRSTLLAIKEINQSGGLLGKEIQPILADGKSDENIFAQEAERLIAENEVEVIFGCWTSASRKKVKPIVEKHKHLLFYPVQYEGIEQSPHIIYTGAAPNQQLIPAIIWSLQNLGQNVFLVGSDYIFPRVANNIAKYTISLAGGNLIGEEYVKLGEKNISHILEKIKKTKPNLIINTINGNTNIALFNGIKSIAPNTSIMSFSISETEIPAIGINNVVGSYACWNYFQSADTPENKKFIESMRQEYGLDQTINDPMEAAYFGVKLWAEAVQRGNTTNKDEVKKQLKNLVYFAPEGPVKIDNRNNHTWKTVRIGKVLENGQFDIVWTSQQAIKPHPYPSWILKDAQAFDWDMYLKKLYKDWGNKWSA